MADDGATRELLERAASRARSAALEVAPNPLVGAVVARDGAILGEGHHEHYGGPHAEVNALAAAGPRARGATLYVTLEPCSTHGKTPPCVTAIAAAGIARVVFAVADPNPTNGGRAREQLAAHGIAVEGPVAPDFGPDLLARFRAHLERRRPWVVAKWAMTVDGRIATRTGESRWVSGEESRAFVHRLRGRVDAIAVGAGTVRTDRPVLTARPPGALRAERVVFARSGSLPLDWPALADGGPKIVAIASTHAPDRALAALERQGVAVIAVEGAREPELARAGLEALRARGHHRLLAEGGGVLLGSLFDARCVDQVCAFVAPRLVGGARAKAPIVGAGAESLAAAARLVERRVAPIGEDVVIEGFVEMSG